MNDWMTGQRKGISHWFGMSALLLLFFFIFFRATLPAWMESGQMRDQKGKLLQENIELEQEIARYRVEKENLLHSYFYNERLRRLLFQSSSQTNLKK